jgi:ubiquitin carboxyl-terminal hydrolase L5
VTPCIFKLEFSLLALRDDPIPPLQSQLSQLQSSGNENSAEGTEILVKLANENSKRERWAVCRDNLFLLPSANCTIHSEQFENSLRRHNHLGLLHALLVAMAKGGKLSGAVEQARTERVAKLNAKGEEGMNED